MINFLVTAPHDVTIRPYLDTWVPEEAHRFSVTPYESLARLESIPSGTTIFSDLERLNRPQMELALAVRDCILAHDPGTTIINDPGRALLRYDLLIRLHEEGLIPYRAYRLTDTIRPERYPVFLRNEDDHAGPRTSLLHDEKEIDAALLRLIIRRQPLSRLMMVEFCQTVDSSGLYYKYGAFIVGNRVLARHLNVRDEWIVKGAGIDRPEFRREELEYLEANPEAPQIARIAGLAGIGYGRIDYSLLDGKMVTWEINTNPVIVKPRESQTATSMPRQLVFIPAITEAFAALDGGGNDARPISLQGIPQTVRDSVGTRGRTRPGVARRLLRPGKPLVDMAFGGVEALATPFRERIIAGKLGRSSQ